ncbi:Hypothetical predicted protein [Mytilus galloprovincialis]|uniref:Uncharacterized protein n=1 Tax=Mytilus galloprovincialis TaxID=29158 RepID=A0A8B6F6G8_MYTGA|nr:Hypothetical predicted protein [Mytilus galloprovincialis]
MINTTVCLLLQEKASIYFIWTVSISSGNYGVTEQVVEGQSISHTGSSDNNGGVHSASMTTLSRMNKDEHAFIRTTTYGSTNTFYSAGNYPHSSFLGMLVYDEK